MKKILLLLILNFFVFFDVAAQYLLAGWDFQTTTNGGTAVLAAPSCPTTITSNFGTGTLYLNNTNGSSTWTTTTSGNEVTSFGGTALNAGTGFSTTTTSPASLALVYSSANSTNGKSIVFKVDMTGLKNLIISYASQKTGTGFSTQTWDYSTNGTTWTNFSTQSTLPTSFSTFTLPTITALDNISTAYIRLTVTGATTTGGNNRIDNVQFKVCKMDVSFTSGSLAGLVEQCTESSWTYYADASTGNKYFAIKKNGNTIDATVDITVGSLFSNQSSNGTDQEHGMFLMKRSWNVNCPTCASPLATPVDVRFFYDPTELTDAMNARDAAKTLLPGSSLAVNNTASDVWFKSVGTTFTTSGIIGNRFPYTVQKFTSPTVSTLNGFTYVELTGVTSFSGGTGGFSFGPPNGSSANGLPVTWGDVKVTTTDVGNEIEWNTLSEKNTSHFEIEYSYDGFKFNTIDESIPAAGNSTSALTYKRIHNDVANIVYYKILQYDLDGKTSYSKTVVAKRMKSNVLDAEMTPLSSNEYSLQVLNETKELVKVVITDMLGREVYHNTFMSDEISKLDVSSVEKGIYQISIYCGSKSLVKRFVR